MTRETLHELIDRIPEEEIAAAQRLLEFLAASAAFRATLSAPLDDEPVTKGDADAIERAHRDVQAGKVVSHEEILREFGVGPDGPWMRTFGQLSALRDETARINKIIDREFGQIR
jgi:hypothetical protein